MKGTVAKAWVDVLGNAVKKQVKLYDRYGRRYEGKLVSVNEEFVVIESEGSNMFIRTGMVARAEVATSGNKQ